MSASAKKKLRKEQNSLLLTAKQQQAQKEAKKLKLTTTIFVIVMAAVVLAGLVLIAFNTVKSSGIIQKNTTALTVGEHKINSVEMSYYFGDTVSRTYSSWQEQYGDYSESFIGMMGLDITKPLDEQDYDEENTWADFFMDQAVEQAKSNYAMYDLAIAAGYSVDEEIQSTVDTNVSTFAFYAAMNQVDTDEYLKLTYGSGSSEKSLRKYMEVSAIAAAYYTDHQESLTYEDTDIRAYEADKVHEYNSYTYSTYYLNYQNYLPEGTEDPTDAQVDAAVAAAKADAEALLTATTIEELDAAIRALEVNAENESAASTLSENTLYTSVPAAIQKWIAEAGRQEGNIDVLPVEATITNDAGESIQKDVNFYVALFHSINDNTAPMNDVRHLLVSFEEDADGNVTDDAKAAAKAEAEGYLKEWQDGAKTEDSFIELVKAHSDDGSASEGGLFEGVYAGAPYVENWLNWSIDAARQSGDCEIVETEFGYHVMYYVGKNAHSYRDHMIIEEMTTTDMETWYNGILESVAVTEGNLSRIETGLVLQNG